MKVTAIGITQASGIAKESGSPYTITRLQTLVPFTPYTNKPKDYTEDDYKKGRPFYQLAGYGMSMSELDVDELSFVHFNKLTFPCELELVTDTINRGGRLQAIVVGFKEDKKLSVA